MNKERIKIQISGRRNHPESRNSCAMKNNGYTSTYGVWQPYLMILLLVCVLPLSVLGSESLNPNTVSPEIVKIGVLAKCGAEKCLEKWEPTADYLTENIPGYSFEIKPLKHDEINEVVEKGEVDFILANPAVYVNVEYYYGTSRIATLNNLRMGKEYTVYGGLIFCRADRKDLRNLEDLKGETFIAVEKISFSGWLAVWRELKEHGIDPYEDFTSLSFGGSHDAVVYAVRDGKVDVGSVKTGALDKMAKEGKICLDDYYIIGEHSKDEYPFFNSTIMYPQWPFAKVKHTSEKLAKEVTVALLEMSPNSPVAKVARCAGWTIPHNYEPVHECLKYLRIGPYKDYGKVTSEAALKQYGFQLACGFAVVIMIILYTFRTVRLNRRLKERKHRYQRLFEDSPVSLWEEDFSEVKAYIDTLKTKGISDFREYFDENPDELTACARKVKISDVNKATLALHQAESKEELLRSLDKTFTEKSFGIFKEELITLAEGRTRFESEAEVKTLSGQHRDVDVRFSVTQAAISGRNRIWALVALNDITERKRAEKALEESEKQLQTVIDTMPSFVCFKDAERRWIKANDASVRIFQLEGFDYRGKKDSELAELNSNLRDSFLVCQETDARAWKEGGLIRGEETISCPDGQVRIYDVVKAPVFHSSGERKGLVVLGHDITERKQAEEKLQESERKYRLLADNSIDVIWQIDLKLIFTYISPSVETIMGYTVDEWVGTRLSQHVSTRGFFYMARKALYAIKHYKEIKDITFDGVMLRKDGVEIPFEITGKLLLNKKGLPIGLQGSARDITERKATEKERMRTEKEQRELLNAIQVGVVLIDSETKKIVNCNPAALKIINATEDQVIGKLCHSFMYSAQVHQCDLINGQKKIDQTEKELITTDGTKIPILKTVSRIMLSGKELILESFIDITEQKKAGLERRMLELEIGQSRKLEAVGSLASGIAHEINTPIQFVGDNTIFIADSFKSIISLIESYDSLWHEANAGGDLASLDSKRVKAKEDADLEYLKEEIPSAIEQTLEGVQRVTKIVRAMKDFAHSDQGTKSMSHINHMLESTLTVARNELKYVAEVETDFDRELPEIECYRDDLNQVFLNLLVNAAHAIADVVGDASAGKGLITVSTQRDINETVVRISDTGTGIPEVVRDRIFDPFFSTKDVGKGSGQGLAIARKIVVDKHKGTLDFETEEGKGTTFIIRLPISILRETVGVK